ncbi:MAG: HAD hydrolase family protein [Eubacteriales bacterium]
MISRQKKFLALYKLPNKELEEYLRYCLKEFKNVVIQAYCPDMNNIISPEKSADPGIVSDHQPCIFCQMEDIIDEPWIKILFSGKPQDLKAMENKINDFGIEGKISRVFSSEIYLEFLPPMVSKGSMLPELREYMGTGYKIYAVGDYNNDMEMLLAADVGIATQNALQGIKDIADMITVSNNESAIADIIYHII